SPPDRANEKLSCGRLWNASMTRSANSPGTSSTTTSSPCTPRTLPDERPPPGPVGASAQPVGLRGQRGDQLVEALGEGGHALVLEHAADVVEVDAHLADAVQRAGGGVEVGVDRAGQRAVVLEGLERRLRH